MMPRHIIGIFFSGLAALGTCPALSAESNVTISFDVHLAGPTIPADFAGLSYEIALVNPAKNGEHFFSPTNKALIQTFRSLGIRSLRIGGNTAERDSIKMPDETDIDSLFAFAGAADVRVIYTLRLSGDNAAADAQIAKYILDHYRTQLTCLALGNEPSKLFKDYPTYRAAFLHYMDVITRVVPQAVFCGPASMHKDVDWTNEFARDFAGDKRVVLVTQHEYPGKSGRFAIDAASARKACEELLSPKILDVYQHLYDSFVPAVLSSGRHYRLEEANSFSNGGAAGASDAFASALWGLDYMSWWASHGCAGINFHTGAYVGETAPRSPMKYVVFWNSPNGYAIHPLAYALKAFDMTGHGRLIPVHIASGSDPINLAAYGVLSDNGKLWLTLINRETEATKVARITIQSGDYVHGSVIFLTAPDITAKMDITLGGSPLQDNGQWSGTWTALPTSPKHSTIFLKMQPASIALVQLTRR